MIRFGITVIVLCLCIPSLGQVDLQSGLVACYAFSGNANDGSGNEHHGIPNGPLLINDRHSNPSSAYYFDGVDDYIRVPASPFRNGAFTFSMWVAASVPGDRYIGSVMAVGNDESNYNGIEVDHSQSHPKGEPAFVLVCTNPAITPSVAFHAGGGPLGQPGAWHHIAASKTDTRIQLYLDGKMISDIALRSDGSPLPTHYGDPLSALIGMRTGFKQPFLGAIDDIVVYDRALTSQEVYTLFAEGLPCATPLPPIPTVNDVRLCGGGEVTLTASGGEMYRWYLTESGGSPVFEGNPLTINGLKRTSVYYVANVTASGESRRKKVTATFYPLPEVTCNVPSLVFADDVEYYSATVSSGTPAFRYLFSFGDGTDVRTPLSEWQHSYRTGGSFDIDIIVTDSAGCIASCNSVVEVVVEDLFVPNVITPNNDAHNQMFTLYHNTGTQYLTYPGKKKYQMQIFNRWGEEVFRSFDAAIGWEADGFSSGVYYYEIVVGNTRFKGPLLVLK